MSKRQGIDNITRREYRWTGGLDYSLAEDVISSEHMSRADNVEYGTNNILKKCDGIRTVFEPGEIDVATPYNGKTIYNVGTDLYWVDLTASAPAATIIGNLAGDGLNTQSFAYRDENLLIASGGQLQKLTPTWNFSTDTNSPYCDRAFIDNGRIMVTLTTDAGGTDSDYRYYSAITSDTVWDLTPVQEAHWNDTTDYTTTALFQEIGYRDGLGITDVQQLGSDYIFTKSNADGSISKQYRATGFLNTWDVTDLKPSLSVFDAVGVINDIYTIGQSGFNSFLTVQQYGDIKKDETGRKVNSVLTSELTTDAKIWHIPFRKQVYVKASKERVLWIYHYTQRNAATGELGAWTKRYLPDEVKHIWQDGNKVYMAIGSKICLVDPEIGSYAIPVLVSSIAYDNDSIAFDDMEVGAGVYVYIKPGTVAGQEFPARISGKKETSSYQFNPIHYTLMLSADIDGTGEVSFGGFSESFDFVGSNSIAFDDSDIAFDDVHIAAGSTSWKRDKQFDSALTEDLIPELTINTGSAGIKSLAIDYSEV
jgi:hypothetical protein